MLRSPRSLLLLLTLLAWLCGALSTRVQTFAGGGSGGTTSGFIDATGTSALFNAPSGLCISPLDGYLWIADHSNNAVRRISPWGVVTTVAGQSTAGFADATGTSAQFSVLNQCAWDNSGNLYLTDRDNDRVRLVNGATLAVSTVAGKSPGGLPIDSTGTNARFNAPQGIAFDSTKANLYICDTGNHAIRKMVASTKSVSTLAGSSLGLSGSLNGLGALATFNSPIGIAIDTANDGSLYVMDRDNYCIRKVIASSGTVSTYAGQCGSSGYTDGTGTSAKFSAAVALAFDPTFTYLWLSDSQNHALRRIERATAKVQSVVGAAPPTAVSGLVNAQGTYARFNAPGDLQWMPNGDILLCDSGNNVIRRVHFPTTTTSQSLSRDPSRSRTASASTTATPAPIPTPTATASGTQQRTQTTSMSAALRTSTRSLSLSWTTSRSSTASSVHSHSASLSRTGSESRDHSASATPTTTPTHTITTSPSASASFSSSLTATVSAQTATRITSPSRTGSASSSLTNSTTRTTSHSASETPTSSPTHSATTTTSTTPSASASESSSSTASSSNSTTRTISHSVSVSGTSSPSHSSTRRTNTKLHSDSISASEVGASATQTTSRTLSSFKSATRSTSTSPSWSSTASIPATRSTTVSRVSSASATLSATLTELHSTSTTGSAMPTFTVSSTPTLSSTPSLTDSQSRTAVLSWSTSTTLQPSRTASTTRSNSRSRTNSATNVLSHSSTASATLHRSASTSRSHSLGTLTGHQTASSSQSISSSRSASRTLSVSDTPSCSGTTSTSASVSYSTNTVATRSVSRALSASTSASPTTDFSDSGSWSRSPSSSNTVSQLPRSLSGTVSASSSMRRTESSSPTPSTSQSTNPTASLSEDPVSLCSFTLTSVSASCCSQGRPCCSSPSSFAGYDATAPLVSPLNNFNGSFSGAQQWVASAPVVVCDLRNCTSDADLLDVRVVNDTALHLDWVFGACSTLADPASSSNWIVAGVDRGLLRVPNLRDCAVELGYAEVRSTVGTYQDVVVAVTPESPTPPVRVLSVQGCPIDSYPVTGACVRTGGSVLTVELDSRSHLPWPVVVSVAFPGNATEIECRNVVVLSAAAAKNALRCTLDPGSGLGGTLILRDPSNATAPPLAALSEAISYWPGKVCPGVYNGTFACSGHGICDVLSGTCVCNADPLNGYWAGPTCATCLTRYANSTRCAAPCPLGPSGIVCNARGVCFEGVCACDSGSGGVACAQLCRSGPNGLTCSGHGTCDPLSALCVCDANFDREDCSQCAEGWSGPQCAIPCPVDVSTARVCAAHGVCRLGLCACSTGFCGTNCSETVCPRCPTAYLYGASCTQECPGVTADGAACSGHGTCSAGTRGSGLCTCGDGYGAVDCSQPCAVDAVGTLCGGHGTCDAETGTCTCAYGFTGHACALACPTDEAGLVCNGHGACELTTSGSPSSSSAATMSTSCRCNAYFWGEACTETCLNATGPTCSGHGQCAAFGCLCTATPDDGSWGGADCSACAAGYFGDRCTLTCDPGSNGLLCSGHGECSNALCVCYSSAALGFWTGAVCGACAFGYYGPDCAQECPGTHCTPCNLRGTCSAGTNGTGRCACFSDALRGYFSGTTCADCASSYYGQSCVSRCPFRTSGGFAVECGGHGKCDSGVLGSGTCTCTAGFAAAADGTCSDCKPGFFGTSCASQCPTYLGWTCFGHGTCDDGVAGTGTCKCSAGYVGDACSVICPMASGVMCAGHGSCVMNGTCSCTGNFALGSDRLCSVCAPGYYGAKCTLVCSPCLNGACASADGRCECYSGYWGASCTGVCPGGPSLPCSGHGVCNPMDGTCTCFHTAALGSFDGDRCHRCAPAYNSTFCTIRCPTADDGVTALPCRGRGSCFNGVCINCQPSASDAGVVVSCGRACEHVNEQCLPPSPFGCPNQTWGPSCAPCPGVEQTNRSCSGHGLCDPVSGACTCQSGFIGAACSSVCPLGTNASGMLMPCSGHGVCTQSRTCTCTYGYFGPVCAGECPGGAMAPCSNRGTCNPVTGTCACASNAYGASCSVPCPGGFLTPCSNAGVCTAVGTCICDNSDTAGHFAGAACDLCAAGWSGRSCRDPCTIGRGVVHNRECICQTGFVGSSCAVACPNNPETGLECSGHGSCVLVSPSQSGCSCDEEYYGELCTIHCSVALCAATMGYLRPQCHPTTGACECLQETIGQFTGPTCADCVAGYWGDECNIPCACSGHGTCARFTGRCLCVASAERGFWSGPLCSDCAIGYIGEACGVKHVEFSLVADLTLPVILDAPEAPAVTFADPLTGLTFTGSKLLAIFGTRAAIGQLSLPPFSTLVSIDAISVSQLRVWLLDLREGQNYFVHIPRTLEGGLLAADFSSAAPTPPASAAHRARRINTQQSAEISAVLAASGTTTVVATATSASGACSASLLYDASASLSVYKVRRTCVDGSSTTFVVVNASVVLTTLNFYPRLDSAVVVAGGCGASWWWCAAVLNSTGAADLASTSSSSAVAFPPFMELPEVSGRAERCHFTNDSGADLACVVVTGNYLSAVIHVELSAPRLTLLGSSVSLTFLACTRCTALTVNLESRSVMFGCDARITLAVIVRFRLVPSVSLLSVYLLPDASISSRVATGFSLNNTMQLATVSVASPLSVGILRLNLFGIASTYPDVLDTQGGTIVTVTGFDFTSRSGALPSCVFGSSNASIVPAIAVLNDSVMLCVAPPAAQEERQPGDQCTRVNANVRLFQRTTDASYVPATRAVSATPLQATTDVGLTGYSAELQPTRITIVGFGFSPSRAAACRLVSRRSPGLEYFRSSLEVVSSTVAANCTQPATVTMTDPTAWLQYSHDGTVFSALGAPFVVVGAYAALVVYRLAEDDNSAAVGPIVLSSAAVTHLPDLAVAAVDGEGNRLLRTDKVARRIRCGALTPELVLGGALEPVTWLLRSDGVSMQSPPHLVQTSLFGVAVFRLALERPVVGTLPLCCFDTSDTTKQTSLLLPIRPGAPATLQLRGPTAPWLAGVTSPLQLSPPPLLAVLDAAGNAIDDARTLPLTATLHYVALVPDQLTKEPVPQNQSRIALLTAEGTYRFASVSAQTAFGRPIVLTFSVLGVQSLDVSIPLSRCMSGTEYAPPGTFACLPCPPHGVCDGGGVIAVEPGYWRSSSASLTYYQCPAPEACLGGASCATGYDGPLCQQCSPGYGHTHAACLPCGSSAVNYVITALLAALLCLEVWFLTLRAMPITTAREMAVLGVLKDEDASSASLLVKILVTHLQLLSTLPIADIPLPAAIEHLLTGSSVASSFNPNLSFTSCALGDSTWSRLVTTVVAVPLMAAVLVLVAWKKAYDATLAEQQQRDDGLLAATNERARATLAGLLRVRKQPLIARREAERYAHEVFPESYLPLVLQHYDQLLDWENDDYGYDDDDDEGEAAPRQLLKKKRSCLAQRGAVRRPGSEEEEDDDTMPAVMLPESSSSPCSDADYSGGFPFWTFVRERWFNIATVALLGVFFVQYPSIVQSCLRVLQCRTIDYGNRSTRSVLAAEMTVDCSSDEYRRRSNVALAILLLIGFGGPLLFVATVRAVAFVSCGGSLKTARHLFEFATGRYQRKMWFWEGVVLVEKAAAVVLPAFVPSGLARLLALTWLFFSYVAVLRRWPPWEVEWLSAINLMSLITVAVSSGLLSFYSFAEVQSNTSIANLLLVVILGLNIAFFAAVALAFSRDVIAEQFRRLTATGFSGIIDSLRFLFANQSIDRSQQLRAALHEKLAPFARQQLETVFEDVRRDLSQYFDVYCGTKGELDAKLSRCTTSAALGTTNKQRMPSSLVSPVHSFASAEGEASPHHHVGDHLLRGSTSSSHGGGSSARRMAPSISPSGMSGIVLLPDSEGSSDSPTDHPLLDGAQRRPAPLDLQNSNAAVCVDDGGVGAAASPPAKTQTAESVVVVEMIGARSEKTPRQQAGTSPRLSLNTTIMSSPSRLHESNNSSTSMRSAATTESLGKLHGSSRSLGGVEVDYISSGGDACVDPNAADSRMDLAAQCSGPLSEWLPGSETGPLSAIHVASVLQSVDLPRVAVDRSPHAVVADDDPEDDAASAVHAPSDPTLREGSCTPSRVPVLSFKLSSPSSADAPTPAVKKVFPRRQRSTLRRRASSSSPRPAISFVLPQEDEGAALHPLQDAAPPAARRPTLTPSGSLASFSRGASIRNYHNQPMSSRELLGIRAQLSSAALKREANSFLYSASMLDAGFDGGDDGSDNEDELQLLSSPQKSCTGRITTVSVRKFHGRVLDTVLADEDCPLEVEDLIRALYKLECAYAALRSSIPVTPNNVARVEILLGNLYTCESDLYRSWAACCTQVNGFMSHRDPHEKGQKKSRVLATF